MEGGIVNFNIFNGLASYESILCDETTQVLKKYCVRLKEFIKDGSLHQNKIRFIIDLLFYVCDFLVNNKNLVVRYLDVRNYSSITEDLEKLILFLTDKVCSSASDDEVFCMFYSIYYRVLILYGNENGFLFDVLLLFKARTCDNKTLLNNETFTDDNIKLVTDSVSKCSFHLFDFDDMKLVKIISISSKSLMIHIQNINNDEISFYVKLFSPFVESDYIFSQIATHQQLNTSTIVKCVAWFDRYPFGIVFEYFKGESLDDVLYVTKDITQTQISIVILEIVRTLYYLHYKQIVLCNLNPKYILLNSEQIPIFYNFDECQSYDLILRNNLEFTSYIAPEMLFNNPAYDKSVDIYAFGVILNELLTRSKPYANYESHYIRQLIVKDDIRPDVIKSSDLDFIIKRCWSRDPSLRLSIEEILKLAEDKRLCLCPSDLEYLGTYIYKSREGFVRSLCRVMYDTKDLERLVEGGVTEELVRAIIDIVSLSNDHELCEAVSRIYNDISESIVFTQLDILKIIRMNMDISFFEGVIRRSISELGNKRSLYDLLRKNVSNRKLIDFTCKYLLKDDSDITMLLESFVNSNNIFSEYVFDFVCREFPDSSVILELALKNDKYFKRVLYHLCSVDKKYLNDNYEYIYLFSTKKKELFAEALDELYIHIYERDHDGYLAYILYLNGFTRSISKLLDNSSFVNLCLNHVLLYFINEPITFYRLFLLVDAKNNYMPQLYEKYNIFEIVLKCINDVTASEFVSLSFLSLHIPDNYYIENEEFAIKIANIITNTHDHREMISYIVMLTPFYMLMDLDNIKSVPITIKRILKQVISMDQAKRFIPFLVVYTYKFDRAKLIDASKAINLAIPLLMCNIHEFEYLALRLIACCLSFVDKCFDFNSLLTKIIESKNTERRFGDIAYIIVSSVPRAKLDGKLVESLISKYPESFNHSIDSCTTSQ